MHYGNVLFFHVLCNSQEVFTEYNGQFTLHASSTHSYCMQHCSCETHGVILPAYARLMNWYTYRGSSQKYFTVWYNISLKELILADFTRVAIVFLPLLWITQQQLP